MTEEERTSRISTLDRIREMRKETELSSRAIGLIFLALRKHGKQERNAARRRDIDLLDEGWNCNCVEDESLGRSVCECADNPANKFGIRELIEE